MAGTGGKRPGAGRKKGSPNKATQERQKKVAATGQTPLAYMLKIMRDEAADLLVRNDMAKAAAPYVHPRLAVMEVAGKPGSPIEVKDVSVLELGRWLAFTLSSAAEPLRIAERI